MKVERVQRSVHSRRRVALETAASVAFYGWLRRREQALPGFPDQLLVAEASARLRVKPWPK